MIKINIPRLVSCPVNDLNAFFIQKIMNEYTEIPMGNDIFKDICKFPYSRSTYECQEEILLKTLKREDLVARFKLFWWYELTLKNGRFEEDYLKKLLTKLAFLFSKSVYCIDEDNKLQIIHLVVNPKVQEEIDSGYYENIDSRLVASIFTYNQDEYAIN